jgi:hypothetical protein
LVCGAFTSAPSNVGRLELQNQVVDIVSVNSSFIIHGLQASSSYDVYCATYSSLNIPMKYAEMLNTKTTQQTACCRLVTVEILQASFYTSTDISKVIRVSIENPFPRFLNISLSSLFYANTSSGSESSVRSIFEPNPIFFTNESNSYSREVAFISSGAEAGLYELDFVLSGESSGDFDLFYASGSSVTVLEAGTEPTAPQLKAARFGDSGVSVSITFTVATNRGLFSNTFLCNAIFAATFIHDATKCLWVSDVEVTLFSTGSEGALLNDTIYLVANSIKAKCQALESGGPSCDEWQYSSPSHTQILSPQNAISPQVSIVAPENIGPCDNLLIDLAGSTGAGGRAFASISVTAESL